MVMGKKDEAPKSDRRGYKRICKELEDLKGNDEVVKYFANLNWSDEDFFYLYRFARVRNTSLPKVILGLVSKKVAMSGFVAIPDLEESQRISATLRGKEGKLTSVDKN